MNDRTLVKVSAGEYCIGFRTVSRRIKSGRDFLVTRSQLAQMEHETEIVTKDLHSFAVLRRDVSTGTLSIGFSWLCGDRNNEVSGWEETVTLPYDALTAFAEASTQADGPKKWSVLSICRNTYPKLVFHDRERLRECLANKTVRKKLSHALRDNFHYPCVDEICFYHDFAPYSFLFREIRSGRADVVGGLILHNYDDDLRQAHYSIHT